MYYTPEHPDFVQCEVCDYWFLADEEPNCEKCRPAETKEPQWKTKPPVHLIPLESIKAESLGYGFGAFEKYAPHDWKDAGIPVTDFIRAAIGHAYESLDPNHVDPESGLDPLCHAMARLSMAYWLIQKRPETDDR